MWFFFRAPPPALFSFFLPYPLPFLRFFFLPFLLISLFFFQPERTDFYKIARVAVILSSLSAGRLTFAEFLFPFFSLFFLAFSPRHNRFGLPSGEYFPSRLLEKLPAGLLSYSQRPRLFLSSLSLPSRGLFDLTVYRRVVMKDAPSSPWSLFFRISAPLPSSSLPRRPPHLPFFLPGFFCKSLHRSLLYFN